MFMCQRLLNELRVAGVPSDHDRATKFGDLGSVGSAHSREMTFVTMNESAVAITMAATIPPINAMAPSPVASKTLRATVSLISGAGELSGFDSSRRRCEF